LRAFLKLLPDLPVVAASGQLSPFDLASIEEIEKPKNRLTAGRTFRTWLLRGGLAVLALLLITGGTLFAQGFSKVHKVFRGNGDHSTALSAVSSSQPLKGESTGHVNILLLGNGGDGHEAPDLTDTMMVASIDTVHKTATMLSVPRDLWVQVPKYGSMKINATYEVGKYNTLGKIDDSNANTAAVEAGFKQADQAVQTVLGIPIDYTVLVNFTSFKQAVDAVGGVTINVPQALVDPTMAWENKNNPVLAAAGNQTMNGAQALLYVRSRETSSDFARSQRQRSILLALKDKVLTAGTLSNPLKVSQLINAFGNNLVTDFSLSDALRAYNIGKGIGNNAITSLDLVTAPNKLVTTANLNGTSIDQPVDGLFQYKSIQAFVQQALQPVASKTTTTATTQTAPSTPATENAQITVLNGTTKAGLASAKANALKSGGYNVVSVGNAPSGAYPKTVIVDFSNGADKATLSYLQGLYSVTPVSTLPDPAIQKGTANIIVILGADQSL